MNLNFEEKFINNWPESDGPDPYIEELSTDGKAYRYVFKVPYADIEWFNNKFKNLDFNKLRELLSEVAEDNYSFTFEITGYYTFYGDTGIRYIDSMGYLHPIPKSPDIEDAINDLYKLKKWSGHMSDFNDWKAVGFFFPLKDNL